MEMMEKRRSREAAPEVKEESRCALQRRQSVEASQEGTRRLAAQSNVPEERRVVTEKPVRQRSPGAVDWQVFEFFSGIGGLHAGWNRAVEIFNNAAGVHTPQQGRPAVAGSPASNAPVGPQETAAFQADGIPCSQCIYDSETPQGLPSVPVSSSSSRESATTVRLHAPVCRAYDVNTTANQVYAHNFGLAPLPLSLEYVPAAVLGEVREAEKLKNAETPICKANPQALEAPAARPGTPLNMGEEDEMRDLKAPIISDTQREQNGRTANGFDTPSIKKKLRRNDAAADVWLLSPPCQPYTRGGKREDLHDPRARGLLHLLDCLERLKTPPKLLFLENVRGFEESQTRQRLLSVLKKKAYTVEEFLLSPTQLGCPNTRVRYYCLAARTERAEEEENEESENADGEREREEGKGRLYGTGGGGGARGEAEETEGEGGGGSGGLQAGGDKCQKGSLLVAKSEETAVRGKRNSESDNPFNLCISPPAAALELWCQYTGVPCVRLRADPETAAGFPWRLSASPSQASPSSLSPRRPSAVLQPVARHIGAFLDAFLSPDKLRTLQVPSTKLRRFIGFDRPRCSHTRLQKKRERLANLSSGQASKLEREAWEASTKESCTQKAYDGSASGPEGAEHSGNSAGPPECTCACCQEGNCSCASFVFRLDVVTPESTASSTFTKGYTTNIHTGGPLLLVPDVSLVSSSEPSDEPPPFCSSTSSSSSCSSSCSSSSSSLSACPCMQSSGSPSAVRAVRCVQEVGSPYQHVFATEELDKTRFQRALRATDFVRFFSREELLRLHGYPPSFSFPLSIRDAKAASLVGNSVNVDVVAVLLLHLLLGFFSCRRD
ncbi:DNA methyltransferase 2, putative [Toxoplasma gondii ME49]|uniref:DNA methyltransferase 2, putative n=2 Tax=Toxoplasma gondii TaxID=5811 RepID=S8EUW9_TOXGM|nr:DNA methyltransferase 2, putative [Toxoplasma gondii ME49]EPT27246.1 DNA methyltransferase 2, putative [Toxoplasma gondii ME49]KYF43399.1 putative DNA methyltransferase 2 [Toxoplasma gondii ARI]|eukprot:XP_002366399.2 DNA methyltransferase 2, putative [Toxoplasma gondii ME49]